MEVIQMNDDEQAFELDRGFFIIRVASVPVATPTLSHMTHEMTHVISHFPFLLDAYTRTVQRHQTLRGLHHIHFSSSDLKVRGGSGNETRSAYSVEPSPPWLPPPHPLLVPPLIRCNGSPVRLYSVLTARPTNTTLLCVTLPFWGY